MPFKDRSEAGRLLAMQPELSGIGDVVTICTPRGGVIVGLEVAAALGSPLDVLPVLDLTAPGKTEYVVGAVAENAIHVIDAAELASLGVSENNLARRVARATARIARATATYRGPERELIDVAGSDVVVVDDGSASVEALEVIALALSRHSADHLILATPIAPGKPPRGYAHVISVHSAAEVAEIGLWYDDYMVPTDQAAASLLAEYEAPARRRNQI